jgi:hypothetical protein
MERIILIGNKNILNYMKVKNIKVDKEKIYYKPKNENDFLTAISDCRNANVIIYKPEQIIKVKKQIIPNHKKIIKDLQEISGDGFIALSDDNSYILYQTKEKIYIGWERALAISRHTNTNFSIITDDENFIDKEFLENNDVMLNVLPNAR